MSPCFPPFVAKGSVACYVDTCLYSLQVRGADFVARLPTCLWQLGTDVDEDGVHMGYRI